MCEKHNCKEEWKYITTIIKFTKDKQDIIKFTVKKNLYEISNKGRVKSYSYSKPKILLPEKMSDGYHRYNLSCEEGIKKIPAHQLVAQYFIPNKNNTSLLVNHIDHIRNHNCVENLEWCTYPENSLGRPKKKYNRGKKVHMYDQDGNSIKKFDTIKESGEYIKSLKEIDCSISTIVGKISDALKNGNECYSFIWKYLEKDKIEGEIWKDFIYNDYKYTCSNMGRFKNHNNEYTHGSLKDEKIYDKKGIYYEYNCMKAHILICVAFNGLPPSKEYQVNHKNKNIHDNRAENLEWLTPQKNSIYEKSKSTTDKTKTKVKKMNKDGNIIKVYTSIKQASLNDNNSSEGAIQVCCANNAKYENDDGKHTSGGFIWKYLKDNDKYDEKLLCTEIKECTSDESLCVMQLYDNKLITIYNNLKDVIKLNSDFRIGKIRKVLENNKGSHGNYEWKWVKKEDYDKDKLFELTKSAIESKFPDSKICFNKELDCRDIDCKKKKYSFNIRIDKKYYINPVSNYRFLEYKKVLKLFYKDISKLNKDKQLEIWIYDKDIVTRVIKFWNGEIVE